MIQVVVQQKEDWRIDCEVYKSSKPKKEQTERQSKIMTIAKKSKRKNTYSQKTRKTHTHKKREKHKTYDRLSVKAEQTTRTVDK